MRLNWIVIGRRRGRPVPGKKRAGGDLEILGGGRGGMVGLDFRDRREYSPGIRSSYGRQRLTGKEATVSAWLWVFPSNTLAERCMAQRSLCPTATNSVWRRERLKERKNERATGGGVQSKEIVPRRRNLLLAGRVTDCHATLVTYKLPITQAPAVSSHTYFTRSHFHVPSRPLNWER